ncbi:zinc-ribbon domain-containing protein [Phaeobacter sp. HF9A]|uniref:zinc-ribbon domain-containing protein n=1 Tax=Phaeobacter sp. HF9A TaxID=2721561 RepID=UPI001431E7F1|nr:zinc-ribbon domain-containing protein [Phaeobacter sp. HF9A]NIZ12492.1 thioredoxin [Phaeobacter sp. HF9A]
MRLICPNCGAQYEVPEDVVPDEGRDVQCSNCGETWFQPSARMLAQEATAAPAPDPAADPAHETAPEEAPEAETTWPTAPEADVVAQDDDAHWQEDPDAPEEDEEEEDTPAPAAFGAEPPVKRQLDPDISRVLREEAEREASLRSRREQIETQTELGLHDPDRHPQPGPADAEPSAPPRRSRLDDGDVRAQEAQERLTRMRGPEATAGTIPAGSRRGLLPDIEEFSSSLSPRADGHVDSSEDVAAAPARTSGFSRGFVLVIVLMCLAILTYSNASSIAAHVPQADPYLNAYVAWVDQLRLWLSTKANALAAE